MKKLTAEKIDNIMGANELYRNRFLSYGSHYDGTLLIS